MKQKNDTKGFSLVELMIVVAIVAILVALALPSYGRYVRKANRGEAQQLLLNWANNQEIWRASQTKYAEIEAVPQVPPLGFPAPSHTKYTFSLGTPNPPTASEYLLIATPIGDQAKDEERSEPCDPLMLDQSNAKTPLECW